MSPHLLRCLSVAAAIVLSTACSWLAPFASEPRDIAAGDHAQDLGPQELDGAADGAPDAGDGPADLPLADLPPVDVGGDAVPHDFPGEKSLITPDFADDMTTDLHSFDHHSADQPLPDAPRPDLPAPDLPAPDLPAPDLPAPDLLVPDESVPDGPMAIDGPPPPPDLGADGPSFVCGPSWCTLPPGTFIMGAPPDEECYYSDNETLHQVQLTHGFAIQRYEVTIGAFEAERGYTLPTGDLECAEAACPAHSVTWDEAVAYCNALSAPNDACFDCTGNGTNVSCGPKPAYAGDAIYDCPGYRLPTDAEWEYAVRAGTTSGLHTGAEIPPGKCQEQSAEADAAGWYYGNSSDGAHVGGGKAPNDWGLYDMAGNVAEWCHDGYVADLGSQSVVDPVEPPAPNWQVGRGGSWWEYAEFLRSAARGTWRRNERISNLGFRCVRSVLP